MSGMPKIHPAYFPVLERIFDWHITAVLQLDFFCFSSPGQVKPYVPTPPVDGSMLPANFTMSVSNAIYAGTAVHMPASQEKRGDGDFLHICAAYMFHNSVSLKGVVLHRCWSWTA